MTQTKPQALIIGASRGIGLELARQYVRDGWRVVGTYRGPAPELEAAGAETHPLDIRVPAEIAALARHLGDRAFDLLIVNAGVYGPRSYDLAEVAPEVWAEVLRVNVIGAGQAGAALTPLVAHGRKVVGFLSSRMGSISESSGGAAIYRSSKAGLNAVVKCLALEHAARGVTTVALHPGWVRTDMGGPSASLSAAESAAGLRGVLDRVTPADNGQFLNYDGGHIPW